MTLSECLLPSSNYSKYLEPDEEDPETGVCGLPSPASIGFRLTAAPGSCFTFLEDGELLLGDTWSFLFLSSVGVAERDEGDLPRSFAEPVIR